MTARTRFTDAEYAEMAADYAANPLTEADIAGPVEPNTKHSDTNPAYRLPAGRPTGNRPAQGRTPTMSVRVPPPVRELLTARAERDHVPPVEVIRRALVQYLVPEDHHNRKP